MYEVERILWPRSKHKSYTNTGVEIKYIFWAGVITSRQQHHNHHLFIYAYQNQLKKESVYTAFTFYCCYGLWNWYRVTLLFRLKISQTKIGKTQIIEKFIHLITKDKGKRNSSQIFNWSQFKAFFPQKVHCSDCLNCT